MFNYSHSGEDLQSLKTNEQYLSAWPRHIPFLVHYSFPSFSFGNVPVSSLVIFSCLWLSLHNFFTGLRIGNECLVCLSLIKIANIFEVFTMCRLKNLYVWTFTYNRLTDNWMKHVQLDEFSQNPLTHDQHTTTLILLLITYTYLLSLSPNVTFILTLNTIY